MEHCACFLKDAEQANATFDTGTAAQNLAAEGDLGSVEFGGVAVGGWAAMLGVPASDHVTGWTVVHFTK